MNPNFPDGLLEKEYATGAVTLGRAGYIKKYRAKFDAAGVWLISCGLAKSAQNVKLGWVPSQSILEFMGKVSRANREGADRQLLDKVKTLDPISTDAVGAVMGYAIIFGLQSLNRKLR